METEKTCRTCANFRKDESTQASGWCSIPKIRKRSTAPPYDKPKYVYPSHKVCSHYEPEPASRDLSELSGTTEEWIEASKTLSKLVTQAGFTIGKDDNIC